MALKLHFPFPIFAPPPPTQNPCSYANPPAQRGPREVRFSRWNNANAERFNQRQREQKEIEDDIRRHRRFEAATRITKIDDSATATKEPEAFKSIGTPSSPSAPSIPGKKSKYSKPPDHPAFRLSNIKKKRPQIPKKPPIDSKADVKITQDGVSYVIDGAPFEFKYSYTETPKVKPLKLREPPFAPFGPTTMPRPWTGRAPLPPSKKKLKEFDSFELPPPNKKGVKPVQKPGPYLPGTGPRYVHTREEILGEPLTSEEITDLVNACIKSKRQLNMGRDGLTHNMLDNIHAHWKRRRVCKIKCKGVCTVDMDNVCEQLEDKTGGKVIYRRGGVLYLFRGRNYNYKTRPRFPLMLWKPVTPVYPRLIQRVPEGLTLEEVTEMRKKGRELIAICKLAKNGLYSDLVKNVREAFEVCELVQINCQGIKGSDYRKIGAKLKDLVPCVLISFENEHILMWRGRNWKSSFPKLENEDKDGKESVDAATSAAPHMEDHEVSVPGSQMLSVEDRTCDTHNARMSPMGSTDVHVELSEDDSCVEDYKPYTAGDVVSTVTQTGDTKSENRRDADDLSEAMQKLIENENFVESAKVADDDYEGANTFIGEGEAMSIIGHDDDVSQAIQNITENESIVENVNHADDESDLVNVYIGQIMSNNGLDADAGLAAKLVGSETILGIEATKNQLKPFLEGPIDPQEPQNLSESLQVVCEPARTDAPCMERVLLLRKQAVETGSAVVLDDATLDADSVYERAVALSRSAPPGPVFRRQRQRKSEKQEHNNLEVKNNIAVPKKRESERQSSKPKRVRDVDEDYLDVVPQGSLRVDELAKLLA